MESNLPNEYLKQIYEHIQDGIIVMKEDRKIIMMNPAAKKLTGWSVGEHVPYCTYCMTRNKEMGESTCYLIANSEVPSFLSQMPTYHGKNIDVEMGTAAIYTNNVTGEVEYLLVLRDQETFKRAQEAEITKKMLRALIEAKESEHKRLTQELHDGIGFDLSKIQREGLGLKHMEERIELIDGTFSLQSTVGKGTFIDILVPKMESFI